MGQNAGAVDFTFQPGIDRKVVRELAGLRRKRDPAGTSWCRKNSSGHSPGMKAVDAGHRVLFMPLD